MSVVGCDEERDTVVGLIGGIVMTFVLAEWFVACVSVLGLLLGFVAWAGSSMLVFGGIERFFADLDRY